MSKLRTFVLGLTNGRILHEVTAMYPYLAARKIWKKIHYLYADLERVEFKIEDKETHQAYRFVATRRTENRTVTVGNKTFECKYKMKIRVNSSDL